MQVIGVAMRPKLQGLMCNVSTCNVNKSFTEGWVV